MASNRIKGITIEIGGDTSKLTDSLKQVDKSLSETQSQLKDVNKLLKLDPTNTELLRQKQDLLNKAIKDSKDKVKDLETALASMGERTEKNAAQYDAIQREIIECKQAQTKWNAELDAMQPKIKTISDKLAGVSSKTGQLAEQTKGLSTAAGVAAAGMVGMAVAAGKTADELLTTSNVTGFTVEDLQKLKYAADRVDVSYETMTGSITKLTKSMSSENKAFQKLGVTIRNEDGTMRSAVDVWYDAIAALGEVQNETERDTLSMELFGKSAMEMAGIVDDGGEKLRTLGEEAENAGLIMSRDAVAGAGQFNDALDELKAKAAAAFTEAGGALAESLIPALEKLIEVVSSVLSWFANLDGDTQTLILTILALVAAISPVLGLISTLTALAAGLNVAMLPMIATIGAIVVAIGALVYAGVYLYRHWEEIKEKAAALWAAVKETFEDMKNGIIQRWENIKLKATEIFENVKKKITEPIEAAKEKVKEIVEKIKGFFNFDFQLPRIKLPHIALTPPGWKIGDLLKGTVPKIGIEWYAKAMEGGVMFDSPTVIPTLDGLKGFGEAGREIVIGQNSLLKMIEKSMQNAGTGDINVSVTVNGSVDDPKLFAREIASDVAQEIQAEMARQGRAFGEHTES